ncbi:hypothetical protein [Streptomyces sp. NPDC055287]
MDWDSIMLLVLAAFGVVSLVLMLLIGILRQLPDLLRAWREVRTAACDGRGCEGEGDRDPVV